jgi:predicted acyl esterase
MGRRLLVVAACALVCAGAAHSVPPPVFFSKSDQVVLGAGGTKLATTLYLPSARFDPPARGWPAVIMFHGFAQARAPINDLAEQTLARNGYAVLTADHRGHGESGGLFNANGADEIKDGVNLYKWLITRPGIDDRHVGLWGVSLGGGVVWGMLKAGLGFAAAEVYATWSDLYEALAPGGLTKSGAVSQLLSSVASNRIAPELKRLKSSMLNSTRRDDLEAWADQRSVNDALERIKTPVLVFQGRRDFAFGLEQGINAYRQLGGPKRLYIGDFGHAPSSFPGTDTDALLDESYAWFARYLKNEANGVDKLKPVELAPDPYRAGHNVSYAGLPPTTTVRTATRRSGRTIGPNGKVVLTFALPQRTLEVFGAPVVTVRAATRTRAKQLVAVLEAVPPTGAGTIVSEGGTLLPTRSKSWRLSFPLIHDTALIAPGSKLRLTLSWTSTGQSPLNVLYVTGVPRGSSLRIKSASIKLPVLKAPVSG